MSLQQIEFSNLTSATQGFDRSIDESSQKMVMDILQIAQYSKPVESTVRELVSNAVDGQTEKDVAIKILTGEDPVEKYYIQRNEAKYQASNWDSSYYDLKHLNRDKNTVEIIYKEGTGPGYCDSFVVRDYGVGLGPKRLPGYFSLGSIC
jgi:hypothetical protein